MPYNHLPQVKCFGFISFYLRFLYVSLINLKLSNEQGNRKFVEIFLSKAELGFDEMQDEIIYVII